MPLDKSDPPSSEMALNAHRIDFTSSINGRAYRLFVSVPSRAAPPGGHPVVYVVDGNLHFGIAVDTARIQACWPDVGHAVVVGIGYPTASVTEALSLRNRDLTTPIPEERLRQGWMASMPTTADDFGGLDDYLRVLDEEVKPRVAELAPLDGSNRTLMGHSLGGLTALTACFTRTASFDTYVAISPSIWWNDRAVLRHEPDFVAAVRAGRARARLLLTVGMEESQHGRHVPELPIPEADFRAMTDETRMVPNVEELAARLAALEAPGLEVAAVVHPGDDHNTVPPAGIARGIRFALRRS